MFDTLSDRFQSAFRSLSGRGRITEENIRESMREVRTALLEADVQLDVVKAFCDEVVAEAVGREVTKSLRPGQEMIGVVHRKLVELMGAEGGGLMLVEPGPTVVMMCGLQGSGKTTTCGKLAAWLRSRGKKVLVAAADLQRPAAVEQLRIVVDRVASEARGDAEVLFHGEPEKCAAYGEAVGVAVDVCRRAVERGRAEGCDVVILDTAGRLHVNDALMGELEAVNRAVRPHQILLVVDAMVGQDAVVSARAFHERLEVDGIVLTKFDSDTRGGAALSVRRVTGAPIRFVGVGEKWDALEEFHAERMAGRILGMGDVVSLVEKAQQEVDEEEAERLAARMAEGRLSMDDFLKQLRSVRRMGPMKQILGLLPGVGSMLKNVEVDENQLDRLEGIIHSMTAGERDDARLLAKKSRVRRVARGAGVDPPEVNRLIKQFDAVQKMTKQMAGLGMGGKMKAAKDLAAMDPSMMPGMRGLPNLGGKGSTRTTAPRSGFKKRKRR